MHETTEDFNKRSSYVRRTCLRPGKQLFIRMTTPAAMSPPVLRRPLFFGPESKRPDAVVFGGSIILILGLLLILSGSVLLTEGETDKYDIHSHHMMIICAGGLITSVGLTCFALRVLTARRVRHSIRSSVTEFTEQFGRRLQPASNDHETRRPSIPVST